VAEVAAQVDAADAAIAVAAFPITTSLKLQRPTGRFRPYVAGGAGVVIARLEASTSDVDSTLRETRFVGELHVGAGARIDVGNLFLGLDARYFWLGDAAAWDVTFALEGIRAGVFLGYRFPLDGP